MTTRTTLSGVASVLALLMVTIPAAAQGDGKKKQPAPACPPGAFCEETTVAPPEEEGDEAEAPAEPTEASPTDPAATEGAAPSDEAAAAPAEEASGAEEANDGPTTVVLPPRPQGQDPTKPRSFTVIPGANGDPDQVIVYEDGDSPNRSTGVVKHRHRRAHFNRHRRWGMNLRVDGVLLPQYRDDVDNDSGMAGLGLSLRYRPTPMFALDFAGDFLGGIDANGLERQEVPLALSAMLYANPRNVVQFYLFGGINWSFARVFSEEVQANLAEGTSDEYTYFGGHAGLGLEFRVSKLVGINVDGLAFIRTRTDDDGDGAYPEFYNPETQEASNSSAGGLLRAGVTFWW
jgi:hypothetical protein